MLNNLKKKKMLEMLGANKDQVKSDTPDSTGKGSGVVKKASDTMKSMSIKAMGSDNEEAGESKVYEASEDESKEDKKKKMLNALFSKKV